MWVVMTDKFEGTLPFAVTWGHGLRGFLGVEAPLIFVLANAKLFPTREEAEGEAFVVAISMPHLIGHLHIMDDLEAKALYDVETQEWLVGTLDKLPRGSGSCSLAG
jgi:hypothetical protein